MTPHRALLAPTGLIARALWSPLAAQAADANAVDLSLEDLLKTEVVTVSRKPESLQSTAAAAFVITREDIERSGATSIPEALRMAPGVQVARIANNRWAVTVRGFNGRFANKLLVLMDGRSIYSPLFSGVQWEFEDTLLEDVERIEVIRGPGAALWGANAVNGVINIITRKARDTQGDLLVAATGTSERAVGAYRHGAETQDGYYRVWGKAFERETSVTFDGARGNDEWRSTRVGARRDGALASGGHYVLSGELYAGPTGDRWNLPDVASPQGYTTTDIDEVGQGAHLLGRYEWRLPDGSESALQSYLDYNNVDVHQQVLQSRVTFDLDYQHRLSLDPRNDVIWGLGYRFSRDDILGQGLFDFLPRRRNFTLFSAFVQDEYTVVPERLRVVAGARLEYNNFTGLEPQPNLRMIWTPTATRSLWAAGSHAVRTPSRAELDAQVDLSVTPAQPPQLPLPILTRNVPAAQRLDQKSERVDTFELGWREQADTSLWIDVTAFVSRYRDLRSAGLGDQSVVLGPTPYIVQDISPNNGVAARTHGMEVALDWHPMPAWRLQPSYSYIRLSGSTALSDPVSQADAATLGDSAPRHQLSLRSSWSPTARHQWDVWLRHVSALATVDAQGHPIDAYTTLDLRYAWRAAPALELSLVGQNLLQARHAEFITELLPSQTLQVQRSVYVKAKYQF